MKDTRRITEGALMTGVYLLELLLILFLPGIIGSLLLFTLPIPFIFYTYRHGWKAGGLMLIAVVIFALLFATVFSLPVTLLTGIGGIFAGSAMYHKRSSYETWAVGSIGFIIGIVAVYLLSQLFFGVNWTEQIRASLNETFSITEEMLATFGGGEQIEEQLEGLREQFKTLPDLIPSLIAILGIIYAFLSQWLSYKLINRVEGKKFHFPAFRNFTLPTSVLWYYFFALILNYAFAAGDGVGYLAAVNVFTLTGTLLILQGFAFIAFYTHVKNKSKALPILAIVGCALLPTILLYLVRILGIIDIGFSLRERLQTKK
ncbi:YybS family protein [Halobacillus shinanisalinarum]|uniref:YybS family protein n=1 Tax=Halobacillus shinanisalinarum TaxID=2932258 RepID=A0ABY4H7D7_9BACI|nr:YybS family protein [Halobacillus shinanisalinarum]UOQ95492.1 YybS family protein [Halobacillus shinanisalinarum]